MRELTVAETQQVNGGLSLTEGAALVATLSMWSPVTFAFGMPIAAGMVAVDVLSS